MSQENTQISVQQLLAKIGQLIVQLDIAESTIAGLRSEIAAQEEKAQPEKKQPKE